MLNYENVLAGVLFLPAIFIWKSLYSTYLTLNRQFKEEKLFHEQHNCVVTYSKSHVRGWPPEYIFTIDKNNLHRFLEPYLCFISSTKHSLDIAMMSIGIHSIFDALEEAVKRGVKVRIIVNFLSIRIVKKNFQHLLKIGAKVAFFIDETEQLNNIMHCKYMVKDYDGVNGYLCMGSLNFTGLNSILNNYEDVTFTSNISIAEEFHKGFQNSWNLINNENEKPYNKCVLTEFGFL